MRPPGRSTVALIVLVLAGSCGGGGADKASGPAPGPTAAAVAIAAGNAQSATVGTALLLAPSVIVRDASGAAIAGVGVAFAVSGGSGSLTGPTATTNASGIAAVGSWTLGASAGANTLTATVSGLPSVTFAASGAVGFTSVAISSGNGQTATVGTGVASPPAVVVRDASSSPVSGVSVTFAITAGGGSITGATATTNASGVAAVGSWTLGAVAGANTLTATVSGLPPTAFTATGTAGAATSVTISVGNGQTASVGTGVATPPAVVVRDASGNPVSGVPVTFAVASGGGEFVGHRLYRYKPEQARRNRISPRSDILRRPPGALDAHDARFTARALNRVGLHHGVVLLVNPALGTYVGAGQELLEICCEIAILG